MQYNEYKAQNRQQYDPNFLSFKNISDHIKRYNIAWFIYFLCDLNPIIQMGESKFEDKLRRCYRQYIQFFNEQKFQLKTISLLLIFQSLSITSALFSKISNQQPLYSLSLLGVHRLLIIVSNISIAIQISIIVIISLILLLPLGVPLHFLYQSYNMQNIKNGEFKKKCQYSIFHQIARMYLITFQYFTLPIILFYFQNFQNIICTALICTFSLVIVIAVDYHNIEIIYKEGNRIIKLAFPYKLFDTVIYIATIYFAGSPDEKVSFYGVFFGNLIRLALSLSLNFYTQSIEKKHQIYLAINQVLLLGILLAFNVQHTEFILFNAFLFASLIFWKRQDIIRVISSWKKQKKKSRNMLEEEQQYFQNALQSKQLSSIQLNFERSGSFAGIFRRLIILGRRTISNREYLAIQVLKSKCYGIQINSRGTAAKIMDCETVMKYESLLKEIVCLVLQISNRTISILKLLKRRDQFTYIFDKEVQVLIKYVGKIKTLIRELMNINEWSLEGQAILTIMFANIFRDQDFLEQIKQLRKRNKKDSDKNLKVHLFNEKTVMVFVNMLDQMGKIIKTSKNLPTILGYNPNELEGIEIDNLLLVSMKNFHIQHMTNFIDSYDKKSALNPRTVLFFINNHNYELQKIDVGYNFVMSSFNMFHMCGIIKKIDFEDEVIIVNKYGNLEGFTKKIGIQLGLNTIAGPDMSKYNFLSLVPALLKYGDKATSIKTIIFKVKNMEKNIWKINEKQDKIIFTKAEIVKHAYELFQDLLEDDIVDSYFVDMQAVDVAFFHEQVHFKVITIKSYQKIMNFCQIKQKIQKGLNATCIQQQTQRKTLGDTETNLYLDDQEKYKFDTNFTLDQKKPYLIKVKHLEIDQSQIPDPRTFQAIDILESDQNVVFQQKFQKETNFISHGSNRIKISRNWKCVDVLTILILCFIALIIFDYVHLSKKADELQTFNKQIIQNNKAFSIILKSLYDADKQDIDNFNNNKLINSYQNLINHNFNYTTFYNGSIIYNNYYLFNVHIPTVLKSIISSNQTMIQQGMRQLNLNIYKIIVLADSIFKEIMQSWNSKIDGIYTIYSVILACIILTNSAFLIIGFLMIIYRRKQLETYEAFFRFEKDDLDQKTQTIKENVKKLQVQVIRWYLAKEFHSYVKEGDIFNLEFQSISAIYQPKIGFEVSHQKEQSIKNGQKYRYIIYLGFFIITQILLTLLYTQQNSSYIQQLRNIPQDIDSCSKIIVSTNYLLASINRTLPNKILDSYVNNTQFCISQTVSSLPQLLQFTSTVPCQNCTILYPYLKTNYRSYYSSFQQMVVIIKSGQYDAYNFTEMIESAAVVSEKIQRQLYKWLKISPSILVPLSYIFSIIIVIVVTLLNILNINEQIKRVEIFLQVFSKEMIENNMRMANLLQKKQ